MKLFKGNGRSNQDGFTIMEVMVAVAVLAIVAMGMASILKMGNDGLASINSRSDWLDYKNNLETFVAQPVNCSQLKSSWAGLPITAGHVIPLDPTTAGPAAATALNLKSSTYSVASIQLQDFTPTSSPNTMMGRLVVRGTSSSTPMKDTVIPLGFVIDPVTSAFVSCALGANYNMYLGSCAPPQVMTGYDAAGNVVCALPNPSGVTCAPGQFLQGVDASGNPICVAAASVFNGNSCPVNTIMIGFNADGTLNCTPQSGAVPVGYGIVPEWDGNWHTNPAVDFTCPAGYSLAYQHYDCGCSNNATWPECVKN